MEIIGKLIEKRDARQASPTFLVREFVIEVENQRDPRYNDFLLCQLTGDRCALLDQFNLGELVQVTFDLRGRKWTAQDGTVRYIMSLNAWRVDRPQAPGQAAYAQPGQYTQQAYPQQQGYQQPATGAYQQPTAQPVAPQQPAAPIQGAADDLPF